MIVKLEVLFRLKSGEDLLPILMLEKQFKYTENDIILAKFGILSVAMGRCCILGCRRWMYLSYIHPMVVVERS